MKRFLVIAGSLGLVGIAMASLYATRALAEGGGYCNVPELDPGLLTSGVALFTGGLMLLRERLRRN